MTGHTKITTVHTGDNVSFRVGNTDTGIQRNNNDGLLIGQVVGIYTNLEKGVTAFGKPTVLASSSLALTRLLVLEYTFLRVSPGSEDGGPDLQDTHPLVRCLTHARFPSTIPHFQGIQPAEMSPFLIMRCTNQLRLWKLSDISGHVMCIPELVRMPGAVPVERLLDPTPVILDVTATAIHQQYHRSS